MEQFSQLRRLGLFDAKVPRYTSYPPATKFADDVTGATYRDWVRAIPAGSAISVYVHIPFCRRLCWFCACRTQGTRSANPVMAYVEALKMEIENLRPILPDGVQIARVHWGGGTPTLLHPDQIRDLAKAINDALPMTQTAEFSVEIDPNEIDTARLDALVAAGMNRASIGVQDFHQTIQQAIGRLQSYETTRDTVEALRLHGIQSLNTDILYGLPHQTRNRIAESVQMLLSLSPDRVALYGYAHVPWMAKRQAMIPTDALPSPEERLNLFNTARRLFLWDGYDEIGIDHFAQPSDSIAAAARSGHLRRNFQGYTDDTCDVLLGLGASAISHFPTGYAQNASSTAQYQAAVRAGTPATGRGHVFRGQDAWRGRMIEMLLCDFSIQASSIVDEFGLDPQDVQNLFAEVAEAFPDVVQLSQGDFQITDRGRPVARMIARRFDAYEMHADGHSSAI